ncbi:MAG TPA: hypothetical protein VF832_03680 [Longimicrobiales bacterium]
MTSMHAPRVALAALLAAATLSPLSAQSSRRGSRPSVDVDSAVGTAASANARPERVTTQHSITINGQRIDYDATVGDIILLDEQGEPAAALYYTAYTRKGGRDAAHRPITFAYNGGPGSSSVWVQMGAFGPRRVDVPDAEHAPPPPYRLVDNQYSPLDVTDLVFIDPVGTGFSQPLGKAVGANFWGVDEDVRSLAQFISRYLAENGRWNSPRYLLGESYGTTRSAALVNYLQSHDNMDFNGVILMSEVLDFQTIAFAPGNPMPYILYLPSYAAVAWYHNALPQRPAELRPFLHEVEHFATTDYAQALLAGSTLDAATRGRILDRLHQYTGLSRDYLDKADLRVDNSQFEKELMREKGIGIGRLDARFTGPSADPLAERVTYDPQSAAISSAYTSVWNDYLHEELNYGKDRQYTISGRVQPWNWTHGERRNWPAFTNVAVDLSQAIQYNPRLRVLLNSGLFDLATPYYAAQYTMEHLDLPASLRANVQIQEYDAGHMMYVNPAALARLKANIASFIQATSQPSVAGQPVAAGH